MLSGTCLHFIAQFPAKCAPCKIRTPRANHAAINNCRRDCEARSRHPRIHSRLTICRIALRTIPHSTRYFSASDRRDYRSIRLCCARMPIDIPRAARAATCTTRRERRLTGESVRKIVVAREITAWTRHGWRIFSRIHALVPRVRSRSGWPLFEERNR